MLNLSFKVGEELVIGDSEVVVKVEEISGREVRLSTVAPQSVSLHRRKVFERIKQGVHSASQGARGKIRSFRDLYSSAR